MPEEIPEATKTILSRGEREGRKFMAACERGRMTVLETAYAAQVLLTHCQDAMKKSNAEEWNQFVDELAASIKIKPVLQ